MLVIIHAPAAKPYDLPENLPKKLTIALSVLYLQHGIFKTLILQS